MNVPGTQDSVNLELYHARLRKQPHSQAIRLRWYGMDPTAPGTEIFVERKTHRESWTGEESVKERFSLPPHLVVPFLTGRHTWAMEEQRLLGGGGARGGARDGAGAGAGAGTGAGAGVGGGAGGGGGRGGGGGSGMGDDDDDKPTTEGTTETDSSAGSAAAAASVKAVAAATPPRASSMSAAELASVRQLFDEVQRAVESKQLQPTLRTVYMRTAFQVPYDASVRCSLDTSLAMTAGAGFHTINATLHHSI